MYIFMLPFDYNRVLRKMSAGQYATAKQQSSQADFLRQMATRDEMKPSKT